MPEMETPIMSATIQHTGFSAQGIAHLVASLQADIDSQRLPGAVLMLSRHGQTAAFESLGLQDPARGIGMQKDSIFRIYSMTKPLVSLGVMMLMEQGKLQLNDAVATHLPEYAGQQVMGADGQLQAALQAPTVLDLLRHTAGLTYEFLGLSPVQRQYSQAKIGARSRNNQAFSQALAAIPLNYQPGTVWGYSRATDVLGRLIEVISGQSLGAFLQTQIFQPLGMVDTGFTVPAAQQHRIAEPFAHDPDGGTPMPVFDPRQAALMESGGGGLMSTAADYARFLQFMLNQGELEGTRLLKAESIRNMCSDHLGSIPVAADKANQDLLPPGHGFGLGFAVRLPTGLAPLPGSAGLYYWGGIAGTTFFVDPVKNLFAMLLIQAPNQREHYRALFRKLVYASLVD
jgi:CubicO group peptidase (beta-lactamase class C family)